MVADQLHAGHQYYPHELEVYVPQALSEYKTYLAKYYQWEAEGGEQPLRPVPLKVRAHNTRTQHTSLYFVCEGVCVQVGHCIAQR